MATAMQQKVVSAIGIAVVLFGPMIGSLFPMKPMTVREILKVIRDLPPDGLVWVGVEFVRDQAEDEGFAVAPVSQVLTVDDGMVILQGNESTEPDSDEQSH